MSTFETFATVGEEGRVLVAGVPFAPGTEVEITISPKIRSDEGLPHGGGAGPEEGLRWEGNVLVHQGRGAAPSLAELREERLNRLAQGSSG
jgi:hypothetical protein